jgi:hypothetical protein
VSTEKKKDQKVKAVLRVLDLQSLLAKELHKGDVADHKEVTRLYKAERCMIRSHSDLAAVPDAFVVSFGTLKQQVDYVTFIERALPENVINKLKTIESTTGMEQVFWTLVTHSSPQKVQSSALSLVNFPTSSQQSALIQDAESKSRNAANVVYLNVFSTEEAIANMSDDDDDFSFEGSSTFEDSFFEEPGAAAASALSFRAHSSSTSASTAFSSSANYSSGGVSIDGRDIVLGSNAEKRKAEHQADVERLPQGERLRRLRLELGQQQPGPAGPPLVLRLPAMSSMSAVSGLHQRPRARTLAFVGSAAAAAAAVRGPHCAGVPLVFSFSRRR